MLVFQANQASAQSVTLNQKGEKIVIYEDGSWRYLDEGDPDDMELYKNSDFYTPDAPKKKVKKEKVAKVKEPKTKKDKAAKDKSKTKVAKAKKPKSQKQPKDKSKTKVAKATKPKKEKTKKSKIASDGSVNYKQKIKRKILGIRDMQSIAFEKERVANFALNKYEREYKFAKKRKVDKSKLGTIQAKYKEAKLQLKAARDQNKILLKQRRAYEKIQKKSGSALASGFNKIEKKYDPNYKVSPPKAKDELAVRERKNSKASKKTTSNSETSSTEMDDDLGDDYMEDDAPTVSAYTVSYPSSKPNPIKAAVPNCNIAFEGKDDFSGKKRVDMSKSPFFSYTSEKMRRYFPEGDMIQCEAYLSSVSGGYKFVCIEVTVASETAQKSYGSIEKQGLLSIRLVDGTNVSMYNNKTDYGVLDPLKKTVLYKAQYLIPNEHVKTLKKVDIDKVRLVWSTGYEDYTIYETDFLINQLNCLEQ